MSDETFRCACPGEDRYRGDWCASRVDREGDLCDHCRTVCPYSPSASGRS